jgi:HK97 family phage major capsid protein
MDEVIYSATELALLQSGGPDALRSALKSRLDEIAVEGTRMQRRAKAENRPLNQREQDRIDERFDEFQELDAKFKALDGDVRTNIPSAGRVVPANVANPIGGGHAAPVDLRTGPQAFAKLFPQASSNSTGGFKNLGEFAKAVWTRDPRLFQNASGMSEGVASDGGFYLPTGFLAGLMDASLQAESIRPRATVIPVSTSSIVVPLFDTTDRSTKIAGLDGLPTAEGATATTQRAVLSRLTMAPEKYVVLVPATTELLDDAPAAFTQLLQRYMVEAMSAKLDYAFLNGTGAGEPLGIVNAPATVSVAKETSQVAATLVPQNLAKMVSRLAPGSFSKAVWLANSSVLPQLFLLTVKVSNAASSDFVGGFGPNWFTVAPDGSMTLFGRPLIITDRCAALGTVGDIILADLTSYLIALRQDASLAIDSSIGFKESEIWFRLTMRVDGQPMLKSAVTPRLGGSTLSPFVTLATRA